MLVCGFNHKTAPLALREQAAIVTQDVPAALRSMVKLEAVNEAVVLSTCNRTELYCDGRDPAALQRWLAEHHQIAVDHLTPHLYAHLDHAAVRHIIRVASGLDSMVLGESQIFGQLKQAFVLAEQTGTIGQQLRRLFNHVFTFSKQVRTDTAIGAHPVSFAYATVNLAKRIFSELSHCSVLLVGVSEMTELAALHLFNQGVRRMVIASRSVDKAAELAKRFYGHAVHISDMPVYLHEADIIVTATASHLPILGKGALERALKMRKHRRMFIADLAVPRDVEPEAAALDGIYLYNIDDLQTIIAENVKSRHQAAEQAEAIINMQTAHFMHELHALDASNTITAYRAKIANFSQQELQHARAQLQRGAPAEEVLQSFAHSLTHKLMHHPSVQLRQAALDGQLELLMLARRLFDL